MKHRILLVSDMHYTTDLSEKELRLTHPESRASLASGPLFGRTQKEKIDLISAAVAEEHAKAPLDAVLVLGDLSIDDYDYRKLPDNYCRRFRDECMRGFPCPSWALAGNHDSYPDDAWREVFGYGRQFSVRIGDRVFVMLDTFRKVPAHDASGAADPPVDTDFLRAELEKNTERITRLQARNGELKQQIQELENLDIVSMVRECGMTPEHLSALLEKLQLPAAGKKEVLSVEL